MAKTFEEFVDSSPAFAGIRQIPMNSFRYKLYACIFDAPKSSPEERAELIQAMTDALTACIFSSVGGSPEGTVVLTKAVCNKLMNEAENIPPEVLETLKKRINELST